jgi:hypothetical protein
MIVHRFRRNRRKGWGTKVLCFFRLGGKLRQQRRVNRPAIELRQPKVAVKANPCHQSLAGCGIELLSQLVFTPRDSIQ